MGDYYYFYYKSKAWLSEKCLQQDLPNNNLKLFKLNTDNLNLSNAHNDIHVSFLSENEYKNLDNNKYDVPLRYNIYQIEQEINILTKDLYQIMMEINTCTGTATYDSDTGAYKYGGHSNCSNYKNLKTPDYWDLNAAYSQLVPTSITINNKTLCQRYHDLKNLARNFRTILSTKIQPITAPPTPILTQVDNNSNLRVEIEKKLDNIYSNADSRELDSVRMLDSTVYTSVLWTVLATSVIFFMFKKM
jgi:hypothetical protein